MPIMFPLHNSDSMGQTIVNMTMKADIEHSYKPSPQDQLLKFWQKKRIIESSRFCFDDAHASLALRLLIAGCYSGLSSAGRSLVILKVSIKAIKEDGDRVTSPWRN